jgi:hypothetical protein
MLYMIGHLIGFIEVIRRLYSLSNARSALSEIFEILVCSIHNHGLHELKLLSIREGQVSSVVLQIGIKVHPNLV